MLANIQLKLFVFGKKSNTYKNVKTSKKVKINSNN